MEEPNGRTKVVWAIELSTILKFGIVSVTRSMLIPMFNLDSIRRHRYLVAKENISIFWPDV